MELQLHHNNTSRDDALPLSEIWISLFRLLRESLWPFWDSQSYPLSSRLNGGFSAHLRSTVGPPTGYSYPLGPDSSFPFFPFCFNCFCFTSISIAVLFLPCRFLDNLPISSHFSSFPPFLCFLYYSDNNPSVPLYLGLGPTDYIPLPSEFQCY